MKSHRSWLTYIAEVSFAVWLFLLPFRLLSTNPFLHPLWVVLGVISLLSNTYLILFSQTVKDSFLRTKGQPALSFLWQTSKRVLVYLLLATVAVAVLLAYLESLYPLWLRIGMVLCVIVIISGGISYVLRSSPVKKFSSS